MTLYTGGVNFSELYVAPDGLETLDAHHYSWKMLYTVRLCWKILYTVRLCGKILYTVAFVSEISF